MKVPADNVLHSSRNRELYISVLNVNKIKKEIGLHAAFEIDWFYLQADMVFNIAVCIGSQMTAENWNKVWVVAASYGRAESK